MERSLVNPGVDFGVWLSSIPPRAVVCVQERRHHIDVHRGRGSFYGI
jgi:hypothetical protein